MNIYFCPFSEGEASCRGLALRVFCVVGFAFERQYSAISFFDLEKQEWRAFRITEFDEVLEAYALTEVML